MVVCCLLSASSYKLSSNSLSNPPAYKITRANDVNGAKGDSGCLDNGMLARKKRGDAAAMFFTSLLSASWLLLLGWAVTRASSQPDDPVIVSPKPIADVLLEPPAHRR